MMSNMCNICGMNNMSPFYSSNFKSQVIGCANANYFSNPHKVNPKEYIYLFVAILLSHEYLYNKIFNFIL